MHMADALISPAVGGTLWAATGVTTVYCARKVRADLDEAKIPLMGVAGAFVFAAQMVNFTIPGTGSSGHLGGGLILAVLLGPEAAFLVMASVLGVQALFFADGGLLALGANIINLGFFPAFVAYPLYRRIAGSDPSRRRVLVASVVAALVGLQLGALGVVLETTLSGVSALPFSAFALVMLPIHLAIGLVEGLVTAGVITFVRRAQPELLENTGGRAYVTSTRRVVIGLAVAALVAGGVLSWFASANPDGLEWSIARITGSAELTAPGSKLHEGLAATQEKTALLPDYALPERESDAASDAQGTSGLSLAGATGAAVVLAFTGGVAWVLSRRAARRRRSSATIGM